MIMPPIDVYLRDFGDCDSTRLTYWRTYLIQTDYVAAKLAECVYLGTTVDDKYLDVLAKREEARQHIRKLEESTL